MLKKIKKPINYLEEIRNKGGFKKKKNSGGFKDWRSKKI